MNGLLLFHMVYIPFSSSQFAVETSLLQARSQRWGQWGPGPITNVSGPVIKHWPIGLIIYHYQANRLVDPIKKFKAPLPEKSCLRAWLITSCHSGRPSYNIDSELRDLSLPHNYYAAQAPPLVILWEEPAPEDRTTNEIETRYCKRCDAQVN